MATEINLRNFDAVIFDMDGVLIDSEPLWEESDLKIFQKKLGLAGYTKEYRTQFIGMPMDEEMEIVSADFQIARDRIPDIIEARRKSLMELYHEKLALFPGALDMLNSIFGKKKIALASSSSSKLINAVVNRFDLRRYFRVLCSSEEVAHGKPAPDIFLYAARKLMVNPSRCLVAEDSVNGVRAGKVAGMSVAALLQTVSDRELVASADWIFRDLQELNGAIQGFST